MNLGESYRIRYRQLGTFRGFGTERARLGTFRGFGTERARLGTFYQNFEIFTQNEHLPAQRFFLKVLDENPKTVLPAVILKKKIPDPQLHQIFKPIRKFFCTFLPI